MDKLFLMLGLVFFYASHLLSQGLIPTAQSWGKFLLIEWPKRFSATCGDATKTRTRNCCTIFFGDRCNPIDQEFCTVETSLGILETGEDTKICDLEPCPYWSEWDEWSSCTKSCGSGTFSRGRTCCITEINQGTMNTDCFIDQTRCPGVQFEVQSCNEHFCMKIGNDTHPGKAFYIWYKTSVIVLGLEPGPLHVIVKYSLPYRCEKANNKAQELCWLKLLKANGGIFAMMLLHLGPFSISYQSHLVLRWKYWWKPKQRSSFDMSICWL